MEKSTILTIPGAKKSVLLDLITREVLLVSNSDIQTYIRLHNKIDSIEEEFIKQVSSHKVITSWLFLTLMCDLECSYCFEKNCQRMRQSVMTKKTVDEICTYLISHNNKATRRYDFIYFGGEPLLNYSGLIYAVEKFNNDLRCSVTHKIITNGFSLNPEKASELINNGVRVFQITLDGNNETHNKRRFTTSRKGTYETILKNIIGLLRIPQDFTLIIRINVDKANEKSIRTLLNDEFEVFSDFRVYIDIGKVCTHTFTKEYPDNLSRPEFNEFYAEIIQDIHKLGLNSVPPYSGGCSRRNVAVKFFSPSGKKYNCPVRVENQHCQDNCDFSTLDHAFLPDYIPERCKSCEFLLLCGGGCNIRSNSSSEILCEKKYIEQELTNYYKAKYSKLLI